MSVQLAHNAKIRIIPHQKSEVRWINWIDRELAIRFVEEGAAVIKNPRTIVKLHTRGELKRLVLERDRYTCRYCGRFGNTIDHVVPRSKGGRSTPGNLVCACRKCNEAKADMDLTEFLARRAAQ